MSNYYIMTESIQLKEQSLVWAKIKGYPWWPATADLRQLEAGKQIQESREKFLVYFIGQTTHAEIPGCKLRHFKEYFDQYAHIKNKKLGEAVKKAEIIAEETLKNKTVSSLETATKLKSCTQDTKTEEERNKQIECSSPGKFDSLIEEEPDLFLIRKLRRSASREKRLLNREGRGRIPLRKFEEVSLEGRIVDLLNKMKDGKDCKTELSRVVSKAGRIKPKDIMNRYVLSGLITASKIIEHNPNFKDKQLIKKLCSMIVYIKHKAQENIEDISCVSDIECQKQNKIDELIVKKNKIKVIRTLYKILKYKLNNNFTESKSIALRLYEYWENNDLVCSSKILTALARMPTQILRSDGASVFRYISGKTTKKFRQFGDFSLTQYFHLE